MPFNVWASSSNVPLIICPGGSEGEDASRGQPGWDAGVVFPDLRYLATYLERLGRKVSRLAVCAHGFPGLVDVDSVFPPNESVTSGPATDPKVWAERSGKCLSIDSFDRFRPLLNRIGSCMEDDSVILFMSCIMASGQSGADLLSKLSSETWKRSLVVGFIKIGTKTSKIHLARCDLPGMKFGQDNDNVSRSPSQQDERVAALAKEPWADENSSLAKKAKGGVLQGKDPEFVDAFQYFVGKWNFEIGDWRGLIEFKGSRVDMSGACYWQPMDRPQQHIGTWTRGSGAEITFKFDDDKKGWQRVFTTQIKAGSNPGTVAINGVQHGFFTIWTSR